MLADVETLAEVVGWVPGPGFVDGHEPGVVADFLGDAVGNSNCNCNGRRRFPAGMTTKGATARATATAAAREEAGLSTTHDGEAVMLRSR